VYTDNYRAYCEVIPQSATVYRYLSCTPLHTSLVPDWTIDPGMPAQRPPGIAAARAMISEQ